MRRLRRPGWTAIAIAVLVAWYGLALLVVPSLFMTTDAAKYVGIGRNIFRGAGPVTAFDIFFPYHSPLWSAIVMAPEAVLGADWTVWARLLNIGGAVALLAMTGFLAARFSLRAALIAIALSGAYHYGFELARSLGLDEAAAATTLAFVVLALLAGHRRPTAWGALLGVAFGVAFLIKEITLPFAPLPIFVVLLAGSGWRVALRLLGTYAAVAFAVTSWWFAIFASFTGQVYRLDTPAWTLVPITGAIVLLFLAGRVVGREDPHGEADPRTARRERIVAWAGAIAFALVLTGFFQYSQRGAGVSLFRPGQWLYYVRIWGPNILPVTLIAAIGATVVVIERTRARLDATRAAWVDGLLMALLLGAPLVLLVIGVGELPRHYMAQVALLVALGAGGYDHLVGALRSRVAPRRGSSIARTVVAGVLLAVVGTSVVVIAVSAVWDLRRQQGSSNTARAAAVQQAGDWLAANLRPGDVVAMGSLLNYELTTRLPSGVAARIVREDQAVLPQADAPLGVTGRGRAPADDWVALMSDPHDDTSFYGYQRSVLDRLRAAGAAIWMQAALVPSGTRVPIVAALDNATGVTRVAKWTVPSGAGRELQVAAYRIDPATLGWKGDRIYLAGDTLERLVRSLEARPADAAGAARNLLERRVLVDGPRDDLTARLRSLAGP